MIQLTDILYGVEVPMDANDFGFGFSFGKNTMGYYNNKECDEFIEVELPHNKWQLIGTITKDACDFDCEPYVENNEFNDYPNYNIPSLIEDKFCYNSGFTKEDSFRSLIESKIGKTWINPLGEEPTMQKFNSIVLNNHYTKEHSEWQQAETNTIKKAIILKQI